MQFTYGIATSTEVAYYSYIYAKVETDKYQKVTSFTRVATLSAIFLSSVTGQVCSIIALVDRLHQEMHYILRARIFCLMKSTGPGR